jgi:hypothetical protein
MQKAVLVLVGLSLPLMAEAASVDQSLAKLAPEERAHEACALKGLEVLRKDPHLKKVDHVSASTGGHGAVLTGAMLTAKEGAVRANKHWYALSFSCQLTPDFMKATTFTYTLGKEIPQSDWERLNLWG